MTSGWRPFDYDPLTGLKTEFSTPDDGETWGFRYTQDNAPVLDANKEQQAAGFDRRANMWHAARVPASIIMEWRTKHGVDLYNPAHKEGVRRLLNDPDYRYLRTNNFRV